MCLKATDAAFERVQAAYADEVVKESPDPIKLDRLQKAVQLLDRQQGTRPAFQAVQSLGAVTTRLADV